MDIKQKLGMTEQAYNEYVLKNMPKSKTFTSCIKAFFVGGFICVIGEVISLLASDVLMLDKNDAATFTSATMIFLGSLLTGLGVYDVIGKFGGAGTIVPITGFANSIVSPAMEFKREGFILGVGTKLFSVAGPVLVYGIGTSVAVGIVYYILGILGWA